MFKKNYDHLLRDVYFGNYKDATRGNPNYFLTYGNGKAAARVQDHLRPNGAHRWHNYRKSPKYALFSLNCISFDSLYLASLPHVYHMLDSSAVYSIEAYSWTWTSLRLSISTVLGC